MSEETIELGTCCICGKDDGTVQNIIMLDYLAPTPGFGWLCVVCHLPVKFVVDGYAKDNKRVPFESINQTLKFVHDPYFHPEMQEEVADFDNGDDRVAIRYFIICDHCGEACGTEMVEDGKGGTFCKPAHRDLYQQAKQKAANDQVKTAAPRRTSEVAAPFVPEHCPACGDQLPGMRCSFPLGLFECWKCHFEIEPAWGPEACPHCQCQRNAEPGYYLDIHNKIACGCCHTIIGDAPFVK